MISGVKATYFKGAIVPLKPLDIEEGADLCISVEVESRTLRTKRGLKALRATAGSSGKADRTPMNSYGISTKPGFPAQGRSKSARPVCAIS